MADEVLNNPQSDLAFDQSTAPTTQGPLPKHLQKKAHTAADKHGGTGKREYDRHSAGPAHEQEKKHGAGVANWGTVLEGQEEDMDLAVQASLGREAELDAANPEFVSEADAPGEQNAMTLDEYEKKTGHSV